MKLHKHSTRYKRYNQQILEQIFENVPTKSDAHGIRLCLDFCETLYESLTPRVICSLIQ
jgi:hypothetical protein